MNEAYYNIQIPIHPDDKELPISVIQLKLPSGKVGSLSLPIQGEKTLDTVLAILALWKPTIVKPQEPTYLI